MLIANRQHTVPVPVCIHGLKIGTALGGKAQIYLPYLPLFASLPEPLHRNFSDNADINDTTERMLKLKLLSLYYVFWPALVFQSPQWLCDDTAKFNICRSCLCFQLQRSGRWMLLSARTYFCTFYHTQTYSRNPKLLIFHKLSSLDLHKFGIHFALVPM